MVQIWALWLPIGRLRLALACGLMRVSKRRER